MCYPQQLGRSWKVFVPEPSGTLSAMCTGQLSNFFCYLHRNHPELPGPSAPGPSELDQPSGTLQHLISHLRRNRPEPHQLFARNRLRRNPSEPYLQSAPELSGTSSAFCPETLRNLISHLHRNPPEICLLSAPEPSGTSSASCPGTVRNLISHLHRNPPEPHQQSAPEGSGTLHNLLRNLVLQLHRIAPELFWAKDPIASFAVGEKTKLEPPRPSVTVGVRPLLSEYLGTDHVGSCWIPPPVFLLVLVDQTSSNGSGLPRLKRAEELTHLCIVFLVIQWQAKPVVGHRCVVKKKQGKKPTSHALPADFMVLSMWLPGDGPSQIHYVSQFLSNLIHWITGN